MVLYIARLSHEKFSLASSEFNSILVSEEIPYSIELKLDEFTVFRAPKIAIDVLLKRSALVLELGELIDVIEVEKDAGYLLNIVNNNIDDNTCILVDSVRGFGKDVAKIVIERLTPRRICTRRKIGSGMKVLKISLIASIALVYTMFYRRRQYTYIEREPHRRPCYRPGTMKPLLARTFVNLSKVSSLKGETVLDPFCGVGGFAVEACLMGLKIVCSDIDDAMVMGAKINLEAYNCLQLVDLVKMDACFEAIASTRVDGVATDPPYGIQSSPKGDKSLKNLLLKFIDSVHGVLKRGRFMVFAIPITISRDIDIALANKGFDIIEKHIDMVHKSLIRVIYVVKKLG